MSHKYTLTVTLDTAATLSNLINGTYSLKAGKLHEGPPGFHDQTVPLHQSFGEQLVAQPSDGTLVLTLAFEAPPPSNPSYWISFQPVVAGNSGLTDTTKIQPITFGEKYMYAAGVSSPPTKESWVPADAFGFQNDVPVKPVIWRSDVPGFIPDASNPWRILKTWVPGSGFIRPAVLRNNLEAWFEQADPLDPNDEDSIETGDQSVESKRIKWSLVPSTTDTWTGALNYSSTTGFS